MCYWAHDQVKMLRRIKERFSYILFLQERWYEETMIRLYLQGKIPVDGPSEPNETDAAVERSSKRQRVQAAVESAV